MKSNTPKYEFSWKQGNMVNTSWSCFIFQSKLSRSKSSTEHIYVSFIFAQYIAKFRQAQDLAGLSSIKTNVRLASQPEKYNFQGLEAWN